MIDSIPEKQGSFTCYGQQRVIMTKNGNLDGEQSLSPWLQSVGFHRNPFSQPFAENQSVEMFQQTYFVADELEQLMLHEEKSVAFLAPYGGGKTAARRYTQFRWEEQYPHAFITVYDNFSAVVEQLPDVTLSTHRDPLLAATAESFWEFVSKKPEKLLALPEVWQLWWWALLYHYLPGTLLDFRVQGVPQLLDSYFNYLQMGEKRPFRSDEQLPVILKTIPKRLARLGFVRWLVLVDNLNHTMAHTQQNLNKMLTPLIDTSALFRGNMTWRFFLPESNIDVLERSLARWRSGLEIIQPYCEREKSAYFLQILLQNRLRWASNGAFDSLNRFAEEIEVDQGLIKLILDNPGDLGLAHRLLFLGELLTLNLEPNTIITRPVWHSFIQKLSNIYFLKKPFGLTEFFADKSDQNTSNKKHYNVTEVDLQKALDNHFNKSEIIALAYSLGVNIEELEGTTLTEQVISLIGYLKRRDRYVDLVKAVCAERPNAVICQESVMT